MTGGATPRPRWRWLPPLAIAAAVAVVFARSINHDFVYFDDQHLILWNRAFRGFGWRELRWMFSSAVLGHYAPVTWLSFALDYRLWGLQADGYHLTNVALHALNAALVAVVATPLVARATGWPGDRARAAAGLAALLWAVHPLRVEAVSWITGRRDVLSGTFVLLALGAYLRGREGAGRRRRTWLAGAVAAYALAVGAKAVAMAFPVALVLLEVHPLGGLGPDPRRWGRRECWAAWGRILPFAAIAGLDVAATAWAVRQVPTRLLSLDQWLGQLAATLGFHLGRTVLPVGLSPLYLLPDRIDWRGPAFWGGGLAAALITVGVIAARRRWPAGLVVWGWYVAFLAPVTSFVHAGPQLTADRYGYLPTLGVFVLAGAGAVRAQSSAGGRRWAAWALAGAVAAALLGSAGLTWRQQAVWADVGTLWAAAARGTPGCVLCHVSWANWLANHERYEEALAEYTRALELEPDLVQAREYIGLALVRLGRAEEALPHYAAALAAAPARVGLRLGYARALVAAGRRAEAVAVLDQARLHGAPGALADYFREVAEREPRAAVARAGLAQAYAWAGQPARARAVHARLAELDPELARLVAPRLPAEARAGGTR